MWKLIFILSAILLLTPRQKEESLYIIIDDCKYWRIRNYGTHQDQFFLSKERKNNLFISLSHGWIDSSSRLSTEKWTLGEVLEKEAIYSSTLDDEAWYRLNQIINRKVFILKPSDFCSDRRFLHDYDFVFYEIKIHLDGEE